MGVNLDKIITEVEEIIPEHSIVRKIKKHFFWGGRSKLYVVTPYWHATMSSLPMRDLERRIANAGHSSLIYEFPFTILSDNVHMTEKYFKEIQREVKKDIRALKKKYAFGEVIVIGMSLGCVNASMIANGNPEVDGVILVVPGNSLAESLWKGIGTVKLREQIRKHGINLEELEQDWDALAPENNIRGLAGKNIEIHLSKADKVIPYRNGRYLVRKMKALGLQPKIVRNDSLGHYLTVSKFIVSEQF